MITGLKQLRRCAQGFNARRLEDGLPEMARRWSARHDSMTTGKPQQHVVGELNQHLTKPDEY